MQKIIVIGCPGSGKSTFAGKLHQITGIPLYYLDMLYWNADKTTVEKSVFLARLAHVLQGDTWIIDGNYASTMEQRLAACDTVFFLDLPPAVCLAGVRARRGKSRPDMPWIETEEDAAFISYIQRFQAEQRPQILHLLDKYHDKKVITFTSRAQMDAFLREESYDPTN